jgi:hypothetical protein
MEEAEALSWSIPEYTPRNHSNDWYWGIGLATAVAVVLAVIFGDFLFGVLLFIGVGSLLYFTARAPRLLNVTLGSRSIRLNETLFVYSQIKAFWIEEEEAVPPGHDRHLLIMTDKRVMPLVAIPIGDVPPEVIKEKLAPHIKEEEMAEQKTHVFFELLGF